MPPIILPLPYLETAYSSLVINPYHCIFVQEGFFLIKRSEKVLTNLKTKQIEQIDARQKNLEPLKPCDSLRFGVE